MFDFTATDLPAPTIDLSSKVTSSIARTKMETGRTRQRARFTSQFREVSAAWELDDDEYALYQGIVHWKLSNGADWFTMSLPFGDGFKTYTVRFTDAGITGAYKVNMNWQVRAQLEIEDGSPLTEEETDDALGI